MSRNFSVARVEQHTRASIGQSERHIERKNESYENMNVDLSRTPLNVHFKGCGDLTYNAHLDKLLEEETVSLRGLKKDAKLFDEMIFDVNSAYFEERGGYAFAKQFYEEAFHFAEREYGAGNIISAVMHADELNTALTDQLGHPVYHYHLHVVALPVVEKKIRYSKRCKDPALVGTVKEVVQQISHSKKWASQKVMDENGHSQLIKSYSLLQDRFFEYMRDAGFKDFERGERGSTAEHLSVMEYKTKKEAERLTVLETRQNELLAEIDLLAERKDAAENEASAAIAEAKEAKGRMSELAPILKNIEDFARKYSDDVDTVLPEAGLETAKSYRKKVRPIFEKVIVVLRGLYHKCLNLQNVLERQERNIQHLQQKNATLDASVDRLIEEKAELQGYKDDYDALCRGYGADTIAEKVQNVRKQERREKELRRANRRHMARSAR